MTESILLQAEKVVNGARDVQYNNPIVAFEEYSEIARVAFGLKITSIEIVKVLMAIKLGREKYKHKEDNLLDLVGYTSILNTIIENETSK